MDNIALKAAQHEVVKTGRTFKALSTKHMKNRLNCSRFKVTSAAVDLVSAALSALRRAREAGLIER